MAWRIRHRFLPRNDVKGLQATEGERYLEEIVESMPVS
jgi:hypothetical protein